MKTLKTMFPKTVIILLIAFMLNSCSSNDDSVSELALQDSFLTAKIDGVDFSSETTTLLQDVDNSGSYGVLGVRLSDGNSISIILENIVSTGTFTTEGGNVEFSLAYEDVYFAATEDHGTGTITITENSDTYIKGTFSFISIKLIGDDGTTKEITEGVFAAKKQ